MKIGFTVGIWDLLHKGHINFLNNCKNYCDYLVAGIMNDYWVRVQKGHNRPIESLELRYTNLKNANLCNRIIVLDTLDMKQYLQICDVWLKGPDQKNMKPFIFENSIIIERTPNISTTDIINNTNYIKEEDNKFL